MTEKEIKQTEKEEKETVKAEPRSFSCFLGLHNWNGGNTCVNCGKKR